MTTEEKGRRGLTISPPPKSFLHRPRPHITSICARHRLPPAKAPNPCSSAHSKLQTDRCTRVAAILSFGLDQHSCEVEIATTLFVVSVTPLLLVLFRWPEGPYITCPSTWVHARLVTECGPPTSLVPLRVRPTQPRAALSVADLFLP